jgi:hypothetical protein
MFAFDQRGQHRGVGGMVEQSDHADGRVEQLVGRLADGDRRQGGVAAGRRSGGSLEQQGRDHRRPQDEAHGQCGGLRGGVEEVPGDRNRRRHDQEVTGPVLVDPVAEHEALAALRHDDEHGIGERVLRRHAALHLAEQYTVDRCRHACLGVRRDEFAQLGEEVGR